MDVMVELVKVMEVELSEVMKVVMERKEVMDMMELSENGRGGGVE